MAKKIKTIEPSRFLSNDNLKFANGGQCDQTEFYYSCESDGTYTLCSPAITYTITECYTKLTCGSPGSGVFVNCVARKHTCTGRHICLPEYYA